MRSIPKTLLLFGALILGLSLNAQLYEQSFDAGLDDWTAAGAWDWSPDGLADGIAGTDWNNRSRIRSASRGGAARFASIEESGQLTSPLIQVPAGVQDLYLTFYQYLRTEGGSPRVTVTAADGTVVLDSLLLLELVLDGGETSSGSYHEIPLGVVTQNLSQMTLQFSVEGALDFWLLDDVRLERTRPDRPTFPRTLGPQLVDLGLDFVVDSTGAPVVPFELIFDFNESAGFEDKEIIRRRLRAERVESCVCDRLELWKLPGGNFFDPVSGEILGDPGEILERVLGSDSGGTVDGVDLNYLNYNDLEANPDLPNPPLTQRDIAHLSAAPAGAVKVAILDTGLDFDHPDLTDYLYLNDDALGDNVDDDADCYADNPIGWNFVDGNNNPFDDHSHGTHVTGIVAENLKECAGCSFQLIPYKTHDYRGVGTLFNTACATLHAAIFEEVAVINASWGFYGTGSTILRNAIDTAANYGALVTAAAGNDSLNLIADAQYPATFPLDNVLAVGTQMMDAAGLLTKADFTNYNPAFVDVFSDGIMINSTIPDDARGDKTGTSMSTPAAAAAAAMYTCEAGKDFAQTKAYLLSTATKFPAELGSYVLDGNLLYLDTFCTTPIEEIRPIAPAVFVISPNPVSETVEVNMLQSLPGANFQLYDAAGRLVSETGPLPALAGETVRISIQSHPPGVYLLSVRLAGQLWVERLVKR
jgi:hypothetical protein